MSTRKADIRASLRKHFLLTTGIPDDINWEGREFTPSIDNNNDPKPYVRETLLPADEVQSANGETMTIGLFEWDVFFPAGMKLSTYEDLADDIKEQFRPPQVLDSNVWIERCFVGQAEFNAPWYRILVRGDYRAFETT